MTVEVEQTSETPLSMDPDENAPFGYMLDAETGERRPKRSPGRQRRRSGDGPPALPGRPPSIEELKSEGKPKRGEDRAPGGETRTRRQRRREQQEQQEIPPFRAGPIARGVNRQYRKAGRVLRIFDPQVGAALIECATPDPDIEEGESGGTVGEAWEELARTNPRVRAWLHRRLQQGALVALMWAHLPLLLVTIPRLPWLRRIPWDRLMSAVLEDDDAPQQQAGGMPSGMSGLFAGLTEEDMGQMMNVAARFGFGPPMPSPPPPPGPPQENYQTFTVDARDPNGTRSVVIDQLGEPA